MSSDQLTCRGFLVEERENAIEVCKHQQGGFSWWIPRSQIGYLKKSPGTPWSEIEFTLPEWLVEKKDLWSLVP